MSEGMPVVLVVDDTPTNIDVLHGILRERYRVKAATNGEKALAIARSERQPDIILLDIMMPGMDGYEVCRRLKNDPTTTEIPVIFITAKKDVQDEQLGLALGAVDYITKPFSPLIVEARVRTQLALYEKARILREENRELRQQAKGRFQDLSGAELEDLVRGGESERLEFKSTLRWNLHTDKADKRMENQCLKTVAAYLNSDGGILMVGVDDEGRALGLDRDRFSSEDKLLLHWNSLLKAHLGVEIAQLVRSRVADLDGQRVLVVQSLSAPRPVFFRRDNEEAFFVRTGNGTQQLKPSEVLAYLDHREAGPR
jgi:CheY-like chemotaxis protein